MGTITEAMANAIETKNSYFKKEIFINEKHKYDFFIDIISNDVALYTLYYALDDKHKQEKAMQLMEIDKQIQINNNNSIFFNKSEVKLLQILLNLYIENKI